MSRSTRLSWGGCARNLGWLAYHPLSSEGVLLAFFAGAEHPAGLGSLLSRLGWLEFQRAELGQARLHLQEGIRQLEQILKRNPDNADYRDTLRRQYGVLANTLGRLALYGDAAHAAEDYYRAAGYRARMVPLAEMDLHVPEAERKKKATRYAEAALVTLQQAFRAGFERLGSPSQRSRLRGFAHAR